MKHENRASHFFSLIMLQATTIKYALGCMPLSPTHRPDLGLKLKYPSSAKTKKRTIGILGLSPLLHQLNNKRRTRMKEINHITNKNLLSHSTIHITLRQSYTPSVQAGYRGQCCKQTQHHAIRAQFKQESAGIEQSQFLGRFVAPLAVSWLRKTNVKRHSEPGMWMNKIKYHRIAERFFVRLRNGRLLRWLVNMEEDLFGLRSGA